MRITSIGAVQMSSDGLVLLDVSLDHAGVPDGIDLAWQPKHYLGAPVPGATVATVTSRTSWRRLNSPLRRLSKIVPKAELMGVLVNPTNPGYESGLASLQAAASVLLPPQRKSMKRSPVLVVD